jgi:peptidoglycan hydrolase CwlO-like protein
LEKLEKEAGEIMGHGGKLKMRVDELKRELREANQKLDSLQCGGVK